MKPDQMRKFVGWCGFYVALPLVVYPAAAFIATINGSSVSFEDILVKGDLLFVVVVLLATTLDWTVIDFRIAPATEMRKKWLDYGIFVVIILALVFYTMMYGFLIATRLPGQQPVQDPSLLAGFSAASFVGTVFLCGAQYFSLLRQDRI